MTDTRIACPGCQSRMQILHLEEAEVDYCLFCGGAYFDPGELERVGGRQRPLQVRPRSSPRVCPRCETHMKEADWGTARVECCPKCGGLYLDSDEMDRTTRGRLRSEVVAAETRRMSTRCALCKETFDPDRMVTTGSGLVCTACYAGMPGGTLTPSTGTVGLPATHGSGGAFSSARLLGNLFDIGFD